MNPAEPVRPRGPSRADGTTVAVLGGGVMAVSMANPLRRAGFALRLYNRTRSKLDRHIAPGDVVCATPQDAARGAQLILATVSDDAASRSVWTGPEGALKGAASGCVVMECSTLSADWIARWARHARERGLRPVEAPVTGSRPRALDGSLIMFAGGTEQDLAVAEPVIRALTERVYHFGPIGSATRFKLINNMLAATMLAAFAEAMVSVRALGLDTQAALDIMSTYGWATAVASGKGNQVVGDARVADCRLAILEKDIGHAVDLIMRSGTWLPLSWAAREQYADALAQGLGDLDMAAIGRVYGLGSSSEIGKHQIGTRREVQ